jgi:hypothetical protein
VLRIRIRCFFNPLDPGSSIHFFRFLVRNELFFDCEELLLKPKGACKKAVFIFNLPFYVGSWMKKCLDPDPGWKNVRIRNKTSRIRNTDCSLRFEILELYESFIIMCSLTRSPVVAYHTSICGRYLLSVLITKSPMSGWAAAARTIKSQTAVLT